MGAGYNSYFQLVQTPTHVAIFQEMGHFTRVIPLDGRPHIDDDIRQWAGDARGRWEGDTLVVETLNYSSQTRFSGATGTCASSSATHGSVRTCCGTRSR